MEKETSYEVCLFPPTQRHRLDAFYLSLIPTFDHSAN